MSVKMIEALKFAKVSPTQKLVLLVLADCHNEQTRRCDPSYAHLMKVSGLSNRAIATALKALKSHGYIEFDSRNGARSAYLLTPKTSEPEDFQPVKEVHRSEEETSEGGSQPPVNFVPEPVNLLPKAVKEVHINRKEPEGTGKEPEGNGRRKTWRDDVEEAADQASAIPLPETWSQELSTIVRDFFGFRHRMATKETVKSRVKEWTVGAAERTRNQVLRALKEHGEPPVIARIESALAAGWQGLHLEGITQFKPNNANRTNLHQRRDNGDLNSPDRYA